MARDIDEAIRDAKGRAIEAFGRDASSFATEDFKRALADFDRLRAAKARGETTAEEE